MTIHTMTPLDRVDATALETQFQTAYEASIQALQMRLAWNAEQYQQTADREWEEFHDMCERFRRQGRPGYHLPSHDMLHAVEEK